MPIRGLVGVGTRLSPVAAVVRVRAADRRMAMLPPPGHATIKHARTSRSKPWGSLLCPNGDSRLKTHDLVPGSAPCQGLAAPQYFAPAGDAGTRGETFCRSEGLEWTPGAGGRGSSAMAKLIRSNAPAY